MRRKPYTATGIKRKKCTRCGGQGFHDWQICADGRQWRVLCKPCDIELNAMVMRWAFGQEAEPKIEAYRKKMESAQ